MFISQETNKSLNEMISIELTAVKQYMAIGTKFLELGYKNFAEHFFNESREEQGHTLKIIDYLVRVGGKVEFIGDKPFKTEFKNIEDMIQTALDMETNYYKFQNEFMNKLKSMNDNLTTNFLIWFLENQVEEVNELTELLNKIKLVGEDKLFMLEQFINKE